MADRFESFMSLLGDDVSVRWLITLLHFLWQGAVVGGVVAIAGRFLRGASARLRYSLYSAALLSLPVSVAVTFCVVEVPASLQSGSQLESHADIPATSSALPSQGTAITAAAQMETAEATDAPVLSERVVTGAATMKAIADDNSGSLSHSSLAMLSRAAPWVAVAHFVGVACFLLRLSTAFWGGHRLRTSTARVTDAKLLKLIADQADRVRLNCVPVLAYCERVAVPTVVGVLRPMVLLPMSLMTGLTPDDFAAIIRHELAHIRRYDLWMNLLQRVIESLLFFHPVVWFISRRLSAEREVCCDELVVSSGYEPMHYAGALLRMAELCAISRQPGAPALAATGDKTPLLERRIERLMNWGKTHRLKLTRAGMAALLMALASPIIVPGIAHTWAQAEATEDAPPAAPATQMKPKHESAQALFKNWQDSARTDNKQADVRTMREPAFLLPDHGNALAVGFANDSTELVSASATIRRWDVDANKLKSEIKLTGDKPGRSFDSSTLRLSVDCRRVIALTDEYVGIWDTATGKLLKTLSFPKERQNNQDKGRIACTPDLSVVACGSWTCFERQVADGHAIIWDVASGKVLQTVTHPYAWHFRSIVLSPDGRWLATCGEGDVYTRIWDTSTGKLLRALRNDNHAWGLQFSPSGKRLAIGDTLGVRLVDARSGKLLHRIEAPYRYGWPRFVFSKDGRLLARMGTRAETETDRIVRIWSTQTGKKLLELHTEARDGSFSDDGRRFAVGFSDRKTGLAVWQLSGSAVDAEPADEPVPASSNLMVPEVGHYYGRKAAALIDILKPAWGDERLGIQYGVALNSPQRQFRVGQRVPLAVFFRNAGDKPLKVDARPDFFWGNIPKVVNAKGVAVEIEKVALLGTFPHYRSKLQPGEALGPLHFSVGLGENPRPGKQNWHPYCRTPVAGKCRLTHSLSVKVGGPDASRDATSDDWKGGELTSGMIEFEIVDRGKSDDTKKSEDTGETKAKRDRFSLHVEKLSKEQVEQLAWGKESHGLRAALLFEPQKKIVAMGDVLKQSYVVRNAAETPLELTATPWLSTDLTRLEAVDQDGKAIAVERISYSGAMPLDTCTLRPGEAVKIPLRDMSMGAGEFDDPWPDILKATPGQTCRLRGQLSIERVALADGDDADESRSFWLGTGVVEFRVTDQDDRAADFSKRRRTN